MSDTQVATATLPHSADAHGSDHDAHGHEHHDPHVAHHFESMDQQIRSAKLGMWVFLSTEILMFGGLFCAYALWRAYYPMEFDLGHQYLDRMMGAFNTVVLIASSFTMAWAVRTAMLGKKTITVILLALTFLGGSGFMIVKYMEYSHKAHMGVFVGEKWGSWEYFRAVVKANQAGEIAYDEVAPMEIAAKHMRSGRALSADEVTHWAQVQKEHLAHEANSSEHTEHAPAGGHGDVDAHAHWYMVTPKEAENRLLSRGFFSVYFTMTGLHGLHVLIGMGLIAWILIRAAKGQFTPRYNYPVDLVGLYWHLVDLIWIFLFPLLYLIH